MPAPLITAPNAAKVYLGTGDIFINSIHVGIGKDVNLEAGEDVESLESGRPLGIVAQEVVRQRAQLTFGVAELSSANIRRALSVFATGTGAQMYQADPVEVSFAAGDVQNIGRTDIRAANGAVATDADITVQSTDGTITYTPVDYSLNPATGDLTREGAGTIPAGGRVKVAFSFQLATAEKTMAGGLVCGATPSIVPVRFSFKRSDCKLVEIFFPRARSSGNLNLAFQEGTFGVNNLTYTALLDLTRPVGQRLYEIVVEP